jgi:hypothetical protein
MKIKTKDGSVIDLADCRTRVDERARSNAGSMVEYANDITTIAILDALESALSAFVPQSWAYGAVREAAGVEGWNECREAQRKAANLTCSPT